MAGTTMVVGSKLPHGLVLRLQVDHVARVNIGGAVHEEKLRIFDPSPDAETHTIAGFARHATRVPSARIIGAHMAEADGGTIGGYAISYVPKEFWDKWAAQNKDFQPLVSKAIIAFEKLDSVEGVAKDRRDVMSGFEPFNPNKPLAEFSRGSNKVTAADAA